MLKGTFSFCLKQFPLMIVYGKIFPAQNGM